MMELEKMERSGTETVKRLHMKKLQSGLPFMINSRDLPGNQCYMEYPNGSMNLVTIVKSARDFTVIRELSNQERRSIRAKYKLLYTDA
jgi:hypothetical protein